MNNINKTAEYQDGVTIFEIKQLPTGQLQVYYRPAKNDSPATAGLMLAVATRVITSAFLDVKKLPEAQREQIEAAIAKSYNQDLKLGDFGEKDSTQQCKPL